MIEKISEAQNGILSDDKKAELVNRFRLACEARYVATGRISAGDAVDIAKQVCEGGKVDYDSLGKE